MLNNAPNLEPQSPEILVPEQKLSLLNVIGAGEVVPVPEESKIIGPYTLESDPSDSRVPGAEAYRIDRPPKDKIKRLYEQLENLRHEVSDSGVTVPGITMVRMTAGSEFSDVARYVEALVFKDWYTEETPEEFSEIMLEDYGPYDAESHFVLLLDMEKIDSEGLPELVGMARAVGGDTKLIKTVHDMQEPKLWAMSQEEILEDLKKCDNARCRHQPVGDPTRTWDYSSMAITENYRNTSDKAYPILSHELHAWSTEKGMTTITTIFVVKLYKAFRFRGAPFRLIADAQPMEHLGEMSVPAVMHLPEVPDMLLDPISRAATTHADMVEGKGLEYIAFHTR